MEKVAIYCRLSKEDKDKLQEDESESIQNQKALLVDYANQQDFVIHAIYIDDDYSGMDSDRPEFKRMIRDAKKGLFTVVICKTQSRFTRDMELVEKYIHGLFPIIGVRFIGVVDHVDTNIKGNKKARQINGLINEWYCEDLSDNIKSVFRKKMESGQYLGAFACYGYDKDPKDNHKLIIDEYAADVVKRIFSMYIQGCGAVIISKALSEEKILPPALYKKQKGLNYKNPNSHIYVSPYQNWSESTIKKILRNKMYTGCLVQGRERKVSYKSKKVITVPEAEWIIVENNHEEIIDKDTFYNVQNLFKARRRTTQKNNNEDGKVFLLSGKVKCKDCTSNMSRNTGRNNIKYLSCQLAKRSNRKMCTSHSIRIDKIEEFLAERIGQIIDKYLSNEINITELKNEISISNSIEEKRKSKLKEEQNINQKIEHISKAISMLYVDKVNSIISSEEYLTLKKELQEELKVQTARARNIREELNKISQQIEAKCDLNSLIGKHLNFTKLNHTLINEFVDYIEVGEKTSEEEQEVIIHWMF